jgi:hypothetical protein
MFGFNQQAQPLEERVMTKLASALEQGVPVTFTPEEVAFLVELGQAVNEGLAKQAAAEEENPYEIADLDGDGVPDHIVGDPERLIADLQELCQAGVLPPETCEQAMAYIQAQLQG